MFQELLFRKFAAHLLIYPELMLYSRAGELIEYTEKWGALHGLK